MKLEYLDATGNGRYPNASPAFLIRLSEYTDQEMLELAKDIRETVLVRNQPLQLGKLYYINPLNCSITLQISDNEKGVLPNGPRN
jgi:hypothetical protein